MSKRSGTGPTLVGLDTGFFFSLRERHPQALRVWEDETELVTSVIVLFEIQRQVLRTAWPRGAEFLRSIQRACTVVPVTTQTALRAARISYGTRIPAVDALILASLLLAGCTVIYTRDPDLERFQSRGVRIVNLERHRA